MMFMGKISEDLWDEELPMLMLAYRTSVQESTKFTPFRLMFGREIQLPVDVIFGGGPVPGENYLEYVSHLRTRLEHAYQTNREWNIQAQKHHKQCYDHKVSGGRYTVGDKVWLYSPAFPRHHAAKFHQPWKGPYRIVEVLLDVTYRIRLEGPTSSDCRRRLNQVVHFNCLKPHKGPPTSTTVPPPQEVLDGQPHLPPPTCTGAGGRGEAHESVFVPIPLRGHTGCP